jgi:hypothetical protein
VKQAHKILCDDNEIPLIYYLLLNLKVSNTVRGQEVTLDEQFNSFLSTDGPKA